MNAQGNLGITIVPAKDTGETFLMVESGRVAGTMNDDGLAYGSVASSGSRRLRDRHQGL